MLPFRSIKSEFTFRLIPAFGALVFLFSYIIFALIEHKIYEDLETELKETAGIVINQEGLKKNIQLEKYNISYKPEFEIYTEINNKIPHDKKDLKELDEKTFLGIYYPILENKSYYLVVKKDISDMVKLLDDIQNIIIYLNILAVLFIGFFSFLLSDILARPISRLARELSLMDERSLTRVNRTFVPDEFRSLVKSINTLINKIEGHINYQKELFVGLAHELKTPLAVIKTKNSVTLMKERPIEKYIETLKSNSQTVDEMNRMTSSILDIGRAEYAQLEPTKKINISEFVTNKTKDYEILAQSQGIKLINEVLPYEIECYSGETLLNHIIQNFVQNAIKFTPEGKEIVVRTNYHDGNFIIEVIDEGCGIDTGIDPFAPFIRKGQKQGVGLGLFLAKNAANAMNAKVSIKNREDKEGSIATLILECSGK